VIDITMISKKAFEAVKKPCFRHECLRTTAKVHATLVLSETEGLPMHEEGSRKECVACFEDTAPLMVCVHRAIMDRADLMNLISIAPLVSMWRSN
jgi:hypothetical protein